MKDAQLNTLCQRHQAVLINSASNSITVAVVDAPLSCVTGRSAFRHAKTD
ncbi:protein transport protein HofB [Salmonella enterica subsp. enterica]|nr:protein transport protein HofB [Salmonella enterica subsp. enterica] [Salmonella enterica subsp. enterica serovar Menston]